MVFAAPRADIEHLYEEYTAKMCVLQVPLWAEAAGRAGEQPRFLNLLWQKVLQNALLGQGHPHQPIC